MRKINPIYLFYSVVLLFNPVHELGHAIIAYLCGYGIKAIYWDYVVYYPTATGTYPYAFLQEWWQYSIYVPLVCTILFAIIVIKDKQLILNKSLIERKKVTDAI